MSTYVGGFSIIFLLLMIFFGFIGLIIYFIPTIVAVKKNHLNKVPIILVNIFLGWSFIGWIVSLVWACSNTNKTVIINNVMPNGQAPYGQMNYNQAPYNQPPYGLPPYNQPSNGQPPYGQPPYNQPSNGQVPYGQAPYGQNPNGQVQNGTQPVNNQV